MIFKKTIEVKKDIIIIKRGLDIVFFIIDNITCFNRIKIRISIKDHNVIFSCSHDARHYCLSSVLSFGTEDKY